MGLLDFQQLGEERLDGIYFFFRCCTVIHSLSRHLWLSWMRVRLMIMRLRVRPRRVCNIHSWRLTIKYFLRSFSPADSRRAVVSFWRKNVHNTGWDRGEGGRVVRRCRVFYVIGASNWYWPTVGQGLLSLSQVRVEGECFCFFTFFPVPLFSVSPLISPTISISFLPFSGRRHKMTLKGWRVFKPQHNQYWLIV